MFSSWATLASMRAHGRQLLALEQRLLLALQLLGSPLAFYGPAQLRANLRQGVQQGGIRRQWLGSIELQDPRHLVPTRIGTAMPALSPAARAAYRR